MTISEKLRLIDSNIALIYQAGMAKGNISNFKTEEGYIESAGQVTTSAAASAPFIVNCPSGAQAIIFEAEGQTLTDATLAAKSQKRYYTLSAFGFPKIKIAGVELSSVPNRCAFETVVLNTGAITFSATDLVDNGDNTYTFTFFSIAPGTYHWKAYYWDEE